MTQPVKWPRLSTYVGVACVGFWLALIAHPGPQQRTKWAASLLAGFVIHDLAWEYRRYRRDRAERKR